MIRALFIILAVLVAVLAYVMGYGWLYLIAGLLVLAAIGLLARDWQRAQRKAERPYTGASASREEDDLSSLGIMEIREKRPSPESSRAAKKSAEENGSEENDAAAERSPEKRSAETRTGVVGVARKKKKSDEIPGASTADENEWEELEGELGDEPDPVLAPYLEALRAALGARTAALLVQEDVALTYRVEALAGRLVRTHARGYTFSTEQPLLTASMARRPVTMLRAGGDDALGERLGYYRAPVPEAAFVALAPVPRRDASANHFLVADASAEGFTDRPEALMERFANLLSFILNAAERSASEAPTLADAAFSGAEVAGASAQHAAGDGAAHPVPDSPAQSESAPKASAPSTPAPEASAARAEGGEQVEQEPKRGERAEEAAAVEEVVDEEEEVAEEEEGVRPRREIIAEEIARARDAGHPLSFALVYLNRADAVAERGDVEQAEPALRARLEAAAPESRLEPFGELAYGLFYRGPHAGVEDWAMDVQHALAEAEAPLDGGVSIGIALLTDDLDDPEALRENATRALHEAYTTGTCTILE